MKKVRALRQLGARRLQKGITMFEVTAAVTAGTLLLVAALPGQIERLEQRQLQVAAQQIYTLGDVAVLYRNNRNRWPGELGTPACNIDDVLDELIAEGLLVTRLDQTAWGEPLVTSCTPVRFDVVTDAPAQRRAEEAAEILHTSVVEGAGALPGYVQLRTIFPAGGVPAFEQLLHRVEVPGRPELNQMQTAINMAGNNINAIGTASGVNANFENITGQTGSFDELQVTDGDFEVVRSQEDAQFCLRGTANCVTSINPRTQFINTPTGTRMNIDGPLTITDGAGTGGDVNILGDLTLPNGRVVTRQGLRWSNNSELVDNEGGSIELGAGGTDPANPAAIGRPYIDFHQQGFREDFNVRLQNTDNLTLRVLGALGNAATLTVEGDIVASNNMQVQGIVNASDVISPVTSKSLMQVPYIMTMAKPGDIISKPGYCTPPMQPRIYLAAAEFAEGAVSSPLYQVRTFATDLGNSWRINMSMVTEGAIIAQADPAFNTIQVSVKCETT